MAAKACAKTSEARSAARPIFAALDHGKEPSETRIDQVANLILEAQQFAQEASIADDKWAGLESFTRLLGVYDSRSERAFGVVAKFCDAAGLG
ncbi:hypothetical protein [Nocardioides sp. MH1]|uniref:hypothetical protein n=1 Tax=Nocardioides sp. MH1 TaxID=3242490 RepID=UPI00351FCBCC